MSLISEVAGSDPTDRSRTFVFSEGGHTFANALRWMVSQYPDVIFCGYTIPHPSEANVHFRIQARDVSALDILKRGIKDLQKIFEHVENVFQNEMRSFQEMSD